MKRYGNTRRKDHNVDRAIYNRLREGMPIYTIAKECKVSRDVVRRVMRERAADLQQLPPPAGITRLRDKLVDYISHQMSIGNWEPDKVTQLVSGYKIKRFIVGAAMIEAAKKVQRGLDPSALAAYLEETLSELRRLSLHAEQEGLIDAAISARRAIGQIIVSLSKNNPDTAKATRHILELRQAPSQHVVSAKMGAEELIEKGWTPPSPPGLPPIGDDELALNNEFEERQNDESSTSK